MLETGQRNNEGIYQDIEGLIERKKSWLAQPTLKESHADEHSGLSLFERWQQELRNQQTTIKSDLDYLKYPEFAGEKKAEELIAQMEELLQQLENFDINKQISEQGKQK